jgi:hypothetical protein
MRCGTPDTPRNQLLHLSLSLADLGGVCEGVLHALPDVLRNFDTVSARP